MPVDKLFSWFLRSAVGGGEGMGNQLSRLVVVPLAIRVVIANVAFHFLGIGKFAAGFSTGIGDDRDAADRARYAGGSCTGGLVNYRL